uniref:Uncharacterized protein n=1 Tax=Astyanax mexicanus TaxID=7994 RepID=A0A3B1IPJ0_ASTMX
MDAPEYLDLDEIDFSDDLAVTYRKDCIFCHTQQSDLSQTKWRRVSL